MTSKFGPVIPRRSTRPIPHPRTGLKPPNNGGSLYQHGPIPHPRTGPKPPNTEESHILADTLKLLGLGKYRTSKLTVRDILEIGPATVKDVGCHTAEDIPWYFLQKIIALHPSARNTSLEEVENIGNLSLDEGTPQVPIHPLDVVCAILHCSDSFVQQEILTKMSMCQFAVPLLLPRGDGKTVTFLLWALRDIVKKWRPQELADNKGFREDNIVNISLPVFSFVRLGDCSLSKSKVLNSIVTHGQTHYDIFVNPDMECGNVQKTLSCGLVEISWFFPGASKSFPEPFAVTNLHGDLACNRKQFNFLTQTSSAVFIFCRELTDENFKLLSECQGEDVTFHIITERRVDKNIEDLIHKLKNFSIANGGNPTVLIKNIQKYIANFVKNKSHHLSLLDMSSAASRLDIEVDECNAKCQEAKEHALSITRKIKDIAEYKNNTLKLQGELWKQLSKTEKESHRMKDQGKRKSTDYKNKLSEQCTQIQEKQYNSPVSEDVHKFINVITKLGVVERRYFFKWMKIFLDAIARNSLSSLREEFKEKLNNQTSNESELRGLGQKICDGSLGVENFIRELSQLYEAECSMVKAGKVSSNKRQFNSLPGVAAELLLDGFPLEMMDGDASNIPLQWITDVLAELDKKTGGQCRMRVITVLGVQSSGKSTLLNTMFGLQFPVASGRCTRGAFMTLIKVKQNFQEVLGCEFILVVDTEGLRAPELESLEHSYEHDNELATLVVGLSDLTIVNISMENISDMKDTLQVVVHAFLRMNEVGKKPICHLVHQNTPDIAAEYNNMTARTKLVKDLNEMTTKAAVMEKMTKPLKFTDIIDYNPENNSWYVPNLFLGTPPMAAISSGYSEKIFQLKAKLFQFLQEAGSPAPQRLSTCHEWIRSLWTAVKYESFIFSFRNVLVAEAYDKLLAKYSELEWNFRKQVQSWLVKQENVITYQLQNNTAAEEIEKSFQSSAKELLDKEEAKMTKELENVFSSGQNNVHLIEKHKEEFLSYAKFLRRDLNIRISSKFWETVKIQNRRREFQKMQGGIHEIIEDKISRYLNTRKRRDNLSDSGLKQEYETMWADILPHLNVSQVKKHNIESEILEQLKREMRNKGSGINELLQNVKSLANHGLESFRMEKDYIDHTVKSKIKEIFTKDCFIKLKDVAVSITNRCQDYVMDKVTLKQDYNEIYCQELMAMIDCSLEEKEVKKLHPNAQFEVHLKLYILGRAVPHFQKMHDNYCSQNDPNNFLNNLKQKYFLIFKNKFQPEDESKPRAKSFCQQILKPAIKEHIDRNLGRKIVDDILDSTEGAMFKNPKYFQFNILKELLEMKDFNKYAYYINEHENYIRSWISMYIVKKFKDPSKIYTLIQDLIISICKKVQIALKDPYVRKSPDVQTFFTKFSKILNNHLVMTQNDTRLMSFQNSVNIAQFSSDVEFFLNELETEFKREMKSVKIETALANLRFNPQEELFKNVIGCGKKCPFCRVPCESGGSNHREHCASAHRPKGLAQYTWSDSNSLCNSICTTDVLSNDMFINPDTGGEWYFYKEYGKIYPEWKIQPDRSIHASDYWKFVLMEFNAQFAKLYNVEPAEIPDQWKTITQVRALRSLKEAYNL